MRVPLYQEVLQTLITSNSCPPPVLRLTAGAILRLFPAKFSPAPGVNFDHTKIRRVALEALKLPTEGQLRYQVFGFAIDRLLDDH